MIIYDINQIKDEEDEEKFNNVEDIYNHYYENNKLKNNLLNEFKKNQLKIVDKMLQIIFNKNELHKLRFVFIVAKQLVLEENIINITI
jgi:hypothetical protein